MLTSYEALRPEVGEGVDMDTRIRTMVQSTLCLWLPKDDRSREELRGLLRIACLSDVRVHVSAQHYPTSQQRVCGVAFARMGSLLLGKRWHRDLYPSSSTCVHFNDADRPQLDASRCSGSRSTASHWCWTGRASGGHALSTGPLQYRQVDLTFPACIAATSSSTSDVTWQDTPLVGR